MKMQYKKDLLKSIFLFDIDCRLGSARFYEWMTKIWLCKITRWKFVIGLKSFILIKNAHITCDEIFYFKHYMAITFLYSHHKEL